MGSVINATDQQIDEQIANITALVNAIDNDLPVKVVKNFGPGGVAGIGRYHLLLAGNHAGDFDPTPLETSWQTLAGNLSNKIQEIRTKMVGTQNDLVLAAQNYDAAVAAASGVA